VDVDAAKIRGAGSNVHFDKVSVAYGAHVAR